MGFWHRIGRPLRRATGALALAAALASTGCGSRSPEPAGTAQVSGLMLDLELREISGLTVSRRHADTLWMHDDGGNPARLFAVSREGRRIATFRVEGVPKTDWEDISAFRLDGRDYLLLADTGDNGGLRRTLQLHVIEEPSTLVNARLRPAWSIVFRWPDGARDSEAVAVDAASRRVLLVSKKRRPPELFTLPLAPTANVQVARRVARLRMPAFLAAQGEAGAATPLAAQVTAADVAPDGRSLALITYRHLLVWSRRPGEDWPQAVAREPLESPLPWLPQAEALGWDRDGQHVFVSGEFIPAPLYRIRLDTGSDRRR
ncbi:MAG: hypothetical protein ACOY37_00285 [Pseudomonadota bacterium]